MSCVEVMRSRGVVGTATLWPGICDTAWRTSRSSVNATTLLLVPLLTSPPKPAKLSGTLDEPAPTRKAPACTLVMDIAMMYLALTAPSRSLMILSAVTMIIHCVVVGMETLQTKLTANRSYFERKVHAYEMIWELYDWRDVKHDSA